MLKLEKIAKSRELSVLLRAKTTLFTRPFLLALGYAALIHTAGLLFFQIAPFRINYQQTTFAPVRVATELPLHKGVYATHTHIKEETPLADFLIVPIPEKPTSIALTKPLLEKNIEYFKQKSPLENPFIALENTFEFDAPPPPKKPMISLQYFGGIAELQLKSQEDYRENLNTLIPENFSPSTSILQFHFDVQVELQNGEIFWWELKEPVGDLMSREHALKILRSIQFTPDPKLGIASGEISITIVLPTKGSLQKKGA